MTVLLALIEAFSTNKEFKPTLLYVMTFMFDLVILENMFDLVILENMFDLVILEKFM